MICSACVCACVYLSADELYPKFKQFLRLNAVYMQKPAKNRIFLYGYMENDSENQNRKSRLHCAIFIYHPENQNQKLSNIYKIRKSSLKMVDGLRNVCYY